MFYFATIYDYSILPSLNHKQGQIYPWLISQGEIEMDMKGLCGLGFKLSFKNIFLHLPFHLVYHPELKLSPSVE